jgi:predicted CoA-binding protein
MKQAHAAQHGARPLAQEAQLIREVLETTRSIAVVGLSPRPERDSHRVARYLQAVGYRILPVHPGLSEVLGERAWPSLEEVPEPVDLVDVFRRSEHVPELAEAAIRKGVRAFWMQLGVRHPTAAARLREAGIDVIEDRCIAVEHSQAG